MKKKKNVCIHNNYGSLCMNHTKTFANLELGFQFDVITSSPTPVLTLLEILGTYHDVKKLLNIKIFSMMLRNYSIKGPEEFVMATIFQNMLLRREIPMAWGTTTDSFDSKNQSFPICNRNKMSNTKGSDLIPYSRKLKQIPVELSNLQLELI